MDMDDRFMRKNAEMAMAFEDSKRKEKVVLRSQSGANAKEEAASCYNCKTRNKCDTFRKWRTGGTSGVVTVGADQKYICPKYVEDPVDKAKGMDQKSVKSMLKGAMKGRI